MPPIPLLLLALAVGPATASPGLDALDAGDRAWYAEDRRAAVAAWRQAAATGEPAAEAMARLRLLRFSGSFGMIAHGPRIDRALAACPAEDPWCALAWADYHLLAPREVGARPEQAQTLAREAEAELPGPARARLRLAGEDVDLDGVARDALGDGLLASGGRLPPYPGTWVLGVGPVGGAGLGIGAGLHFAHPDLGWGGGRLAVEAGGTSRGDAWLAGAWRGSGALVAGADGRLSRWVEDRWDGDEAAASVVEQARIAAGPGVRWGAQAVQLAVGPRWDRVDGDLLAGTGVGLDWCLDRRDADPGGWAALGTRAALRPLGADYDHLAGRADLRGYLELGGAGTLAGRLLGERAFLDGAPWFLMPTAGGPEVLRGASAGRYRGRSLVAADLEWRRDLFPALEGVVFAAGAWVEGTGAHPAGGLGLRLRLPPAHAESVRLDLGVSDAGWTLSTGWGEAF